MEEIAYRIKDWFDDWLLGCIKDALIIWAIVSFPTFLCFGLSLNADYTSIYHKLAYAFRWVWVVYTGFTVLAIVNWFIRVLLRFIKKLREEL